MAWEEVPPPEETRPSELLRGIGWAQRPAKLIAGGLLRSYFSLQVLGAERVPELGPVLMAPNHRSMWDVPLLGVASPRPITFMGKREVFSVGPRAALFRALGGFPVRRDGSDYEAMKRSLGVLRDGRVLCLYPEGTRHRGPTLGPFLPGAAWLALAEGVPLVPVGISGTERISPRGRVLPRRASVRIAFGDVIDVERDPAPGRRQQRAAEITADLRRRVQSLVG